MKKLFFLFVIFFGTGMPVPYKSNLFAAENTKLTGTALIKKSIDVSSPDTMYSVTKQIVYTYTGKKRVFQIKNWSKGKNAKMLMEYIKPARVKGDKFLFLKEGDIYAYFSKTGRIRRIASSAKKAKMQGSDFSYEDMSMMTTIDKDFKAKILKEDKFNGKKCYVLQLKPIKKDISYNKLIAYINKENFTLLKLDFYKANKLIKTMIQKEYKKINGFYIPYTIIMKSIKNETRTEIYTEKVKINIYIPDRKFTKSYLSR